MRLFIGTILVSGIVALFGQTIAQAFNYGTGTYGTCQYGTCSITITTDSSLNLPVTPVALGARCTVAGSGVTVSTGSSTGYTLTLSTTTAATALTDAGLGLSIAASAGSPGTPAALGANQWGYRTDSGAFGAGPTTAQSNVSPPALTFAGVPSSGNAATVYTQASAASGVVTDVWYGLCANMQQAAGAYTNSVQYSAIIN